MTMITKLNDALAACVKGIVVSITCVMLVTLAAQVFMRYFLNIALTWSEELSLTLFCWTVLLSSALCVRENRHVRLSLLIERVPAGLRVNAERLVHLLTMFFGLYLAQAGWTYVMETEGMTSAAVGFSIAYLYAAGPVCGALIALFSLEHAILGNIPALESEQ